MGCVLVQMHMMRNRNFWGFIQTGLLKRKVSTGPEVPAQVHTLFVSTATVHLRFSSSFLGIAAFPRSQPSYLPSFFL